MPYDPTIPDEKRRQHGKRDLIRELFAELGDVDKVAAKAEVHRRTVLLHTRGMRKLPACKVVYTQEQWDQVERWLREEEGSFAEAARTFGMATTTIARRFPHLGWRREDAARWVAQVNRIERRLEKQTYANTRR